jgi:RNA polymerase sigma-70 factor (ECF subfamily)
VTETTGNAQGEHRRAGQDAAVAFEAIFHEHWTRVYALLFRLVGDRAEAEDLALEVFWRLYRRPPAREHGSNLSSWLYRVATNLGYNALRAFKRRQRYEEEAGRLALEAAPAPDPGIAAERAQEREQVRHVLARMKPRSAQLLILRHSGLSYAELAAALGVSPASIGTMLARAEREFEAQYRALEGR